MSASQLTTHRRPVRRLLALTAVAALGFAACSDDDGADVRSSGETGSGSGSASGSASGSDASGSEASGSAAAGECTVVDGTDGVAEADTVVAVALDDWSVTPEPTTAAAGAIGFSVENVGEHAHELVIAAGTVDDLTVVDGAPDEEALGDALIGEIEAFAPGETCEGTFELAAGDYVLFCALVEEEADGTMESHYEEGMVTTFTVS